MTGNEGVGGSTRIGWIIRGPTSSIIGWLRRARNWFIEVEEVDGAGWDSFTDEEEEETRLEDWIDTRVWIMPDRVVPTGCVDGETDERLICLSCGDVIEACECHPVPRF